MTGLFRLIALETSSACNRKCWFCKFGQPREDEPVSRMSMELVERIILNLKDLSYTGRLSWYKINEPLLDKRLPDMIRLAKDHVPDCHQTVLTNGDLLDRERGTRLFDAGIDVVGVSVYDDETIVKMGQLQDDGLPVVWLDHRRPNEAGFVENRGGNIELITEETREQLTEDRTGYDCQRPSTAMNIQTNGGVSLCCADMYGDVIMGNVARNRLEEVWYGAAFEQVRKRLKTRGRVGLQLCESCTWFGGGHHVHWPQ